MLGAHVARLVAEYLQAAPRSAVAEAVETLAGPGLLRMVHTRHGALVACIVLAFGTAKDRKKAVKAMKGAPLSLLLCRSGLICVSAVL